MKKYLKTYLMLTTALVLTACNGGSTSTNPGPAQGGNGSSLNPAYWTIGPVINGVNSSHNVPLHPTAEAGGWVFNFPVGVDGVHYVTTNYAGSIGHFSNLHIKYSITGGGKFVANDGCSPSLIRPYFQEAGDDWSGAGVFEGYRWWGNGKATQLADGTFTIDISLTDVTQWGDVFAHQDPSWFNMAKGNVGNIGFTFGACSGGHGVYATSPTQFHLLEFSLQ